ncbi:VOC family protein [Acidimangrovimonas sediminis]|uniref:VOC family protein n=1 Tax=Acidimangrovimonas sediminis TaxID=2056283 RepID=UPI000C7FB6E4|nr:VOC family protein [Acidimangrovimonas sediminis]
MTIRRIVANLKAEAPAGLAAFYRDLFGLDTLMELDFITTLGVRPGAGGGPEDGAGGGAPAPIQLSLASEGGAGTPLPLLSIEVDDIAPYLERAHALGAEIAHGPVTEPWGVRRFYLRDPEGHLVNVVMHNRES